MQHDRFEMGLCGVGTAPCTGYCMHAPVAAQPLGHMANYKMDNQKASHVAHANLADSDPWWTFQEKSTAGMTASYACSIDCEPSQTY